MIIEKAAGTYNLKDAKLYLVPTAFIVEYNTPLSLSPLGIAIPFNNIEKTIKKNRMLLITKTDGETIRLTFFKKSKVEFFYNYLINNKTSMPPNDTQCLFCGEILRGEYCIACGHNRVEIVQDKKEVNQLRRCWSCGGELATEVKVCPDCGAKQNVNKLLVRVAGEAVKKNIIAVCPKCHSKNIKVYRKGYNYRLGFWGSIFGIRGAGYAGGFDANKACCHCMDCGKDWKTDYDYRTLG